ncbi:lysylphosphatidylglycerol synthase transmembrane domain-containing protein [Phenylobacterium immobile]|uniref:lysylphosphatidylglycerol synthase transmembrane domain-containing protein n=1 Tax=Phenylobacterium immobile TaxID=21 RepID=UPI000AF8CCA4|nr:YbhN family protein [Phenylobacterium immobile]
MPGLADSGDIQPVQKPDLRERLSASRSTPPLKTDPSAFYELDQADPDTPLTTEFAAALPDRRAPLSRLARRWALRLVPVVLLIAAIGILWREFHELSLIQVLRAMRAWGPGSIAAALALSAVSFILMGFVERLGLRWAGARVPTSSVFAGAFLANAIAHSLGANLLVAGAIRAKFYERYGVGLRQVAATTLFNGLAFAVGLSALGGACMLLAPPSELARTAAPANVARTFGLILVCVPAIYVALCAIKHAPIHAFGRSLRLPSVKSAVGQVVIGVSDNATAAAIVWVLLPDDMVGYITFVGAYAVATVIGLASSVPAGAGVFESSILTLLHTQNAAAVAAAFLGYRLAYFLLPLAVASTALLIDSFIHRRKT